MNVTHSADPQAVAKLNKWANFNATARFPPIAVEEPIWPVDFDPKVSGDTTMPRAKNETITTKRVNQAIFVAWFSKKAQYKEEKIEKRSVWPSHFLL